MSDSERTDRVTVVSDAAVAAGRVLAQGLRGKGSALSPGAAAWRKENAAELVERFVQQPDMGGDSFDDKLRKQLDGASDEVLLLFAELYYLSLVPLADYRGDSKRALVRGVLAKMTVPAALPEDLASALDSQDFSGGLAFKTRRYWQMCYLVEFAHSFLSEEPPPSIWDDPLEFRRRLDAGTTTNAPSQRHSLLYLAFPEFFLPLVSDRHRTLIRNAFIDVLDRASGDVDVDLHEIASRLSSEQGEPVDFYVDPWWSRWDPQHRESVNNPDGSAQRAWLVRGSSVDGHDLIPLWRQEGYASLRASKLREVQPGMEREDLRVIVNEDYSQTSYAAKAAKLDEFHSFLSRMQVGDVIATTSQGALYLGAVTGPAEYVKSADGLSNLRRAVDWAPEGCDYGDLASEIKARLQVQYDVVEMTQQLDLLEKLLAAQTTVVPDDEPPSPPVVVRELTLPDATDELADRLNVDRAWLQECVDLLRDRPQLIFYGPPGTGKTFIAQHLAAHLAGDNVRLVQFHPAYSYEDFFEGYRPSEEGGFKLKPGPLRKTVDAARESPSTPYFLIIDEINRGNLAKIFGELYFLLEYRSQNVDLLYATDDDIGFTLPENVFIIGTMNTADRSIALVDAAMRRRFAFVPLHPSEPPTSGVLRRWLTASDLDVGIADLLDELNRRIEDPDFKIGPSYFMRKGVHEPGGLERAWRTAILPLLEEHHYGDGTDVRARYGLNAIRARVAGRSASDQAGSDGGQSADPA